MSGKKLQGIIAPLVTPFTKSGEIDESLLKDEVKYLLDSGVDGVSPGGSTGEGAALSDEELAQMVRIIRETAPNILIVAGVIRNCTKAAVNGCLAAKEAGADALMVTPVSYNVLVPDNEGNYEFYKTISDTAGLPIVIYNVVPQNTIRPQLFLQLLNIENVVGIKQSCGGIAAFYEMENICGKKGKIFSATDDMLYSTFELGASGAISAILTVFPEICVRMWHDVKNGKMKEAKELQDRIYLTWQAIAGNQFPIRIKYALKLLGRHPGYARSPIVHISKEDKTNIENALLKGGFIK